MKILLIYLLFVHAFSSIEECYNCENPSRENCLSIYVEKERGMMCCYGVNTCHPIGEDYYYIFTDPKKIAIQREIDGYNYYIKNRKKMYTFFDFTTSSQYITQCSKGNIIYEGKYILKEEDKSVLQNQNHCLHFHFNVLSETINDVKEEQCQNANLLQLSKDNNIGCGFFNFTITLKNKQTFNFKTCYLLNLDELWQLDKQSKKQIFDDYLFDSLGYMDIDMENINSYRGEILDSKSGFSFIYSENEELESSTIISTSKLLFLFIFSLLF